MGGRYMFSAQSSIPSSAFCGLPGLLPVCTMIADCRFTLRIVLQCSIFMVPLPSLITPSQYCWKCIEQEDSNICAASMADATPYNRVKHCSAATRCYKSGSITQPNGRFCIFGRISDTALRGFFRGSLKSSYGRSESSHECWFQNRESFFADLDVMLPLMGQ